MTDYQPVEEPSAHDAQRELEHKALRNVRGLVDRMEHDEEARRRSQKWVIAGLAALVVLVGAIVGIAVTRTPGAGQEIPVPPVSKAPSR